MGASIIKRQALRSLTVMLGGRLPLSDWGWARGLPVDRHYIDAFLEAHREDIRGRVLEVKEPLYTRRYGSAVERSDVLDIDAGNRAATIHADLSTADEIDSDSFDCFILTQTLQLIYDVRAAIAHSNRILKPGGILLATVPSITRACTGGPLADDYSRFTGSGCRRLFSESFGSDAVDVQEHGNFVTSFAFLAGLASQDLRERDLRRADERFPTLVSIRAQKARL